uniref:Cation-transporting ATPase n=1 Tax=Kalmanozyma brasiliensis (strain GHG001) TaxID=1365824 RepID=V5EXE9_KALBG
MTEPDRSRRGGQSSSKSKQHFEVAADEYQAPFQLPAKKSEAISASSERSVSPDSVAGRRKPASQRSGSTYHFGRRKRVPEDADLTGTSQPKGMLGSILASIRGDRGDDDNDDARSRRSFSRPLLSRRRSSQSNISSRAGRSDAGDEDEDEDYDNTRGWSDDDYGFDDEDDDDSYRSSDDDASNRNGILPSAFGTLSGAVDPVFGDTRFSTDHPPEDELDAELAGRDLETGEPSGFGRSEGDVNARGRTSGQSVEAARTELSYLDKSSKSRQQVYLMEEDTLIRFTGYKTLVGKQVIYTIVCCLTLGIVYLIGRWLPRFRLKYVCKETEFEKAEFIMIENQWGDLHKEKIDTIPFARPLATTEQLMELTFFDFRYTRYALHPPTGRFRMIKDWRDPLWTSLAAINNGISFDAEKDRSTIFGKNAIEIQAKSTWQLLVDEVLHPFYMFQIVSIILWSFDNYYYYAFCIAVISLVSIFTTLLETRQTVNRMREMSRFSCDVRVLREGNWQVLDSNDLVPGDVYDVAEPGLLLFPADSVLLSGDAIVNESMLTGESVPVSKIPLTTPSMVGLHAAGTEVTADLAKHFLFSGTRIIRIRGSGSTDKNEAGAKAMVVRTGFNTTKGALVRSMLFPKPMGFKFYRDSFRFIGFLAMIAGIGFLFAAVNFVKMGIAWHTIVIRALDLITVVVPPALPATMSIGISFAINRLRKVGIFCISPNRVIIGGKVDVFCFDKTGTLTAEGLDVLGTRTIDLKAGRFSELHESVDEMPVGAGTKSDADARKMPLLYALATCHSLKVVDGEVIGDPLDVKMFEHTGWTLDEGKDRSAKATTKTGTAKNGKSKLTERPPALVQTVVRPPGGQAFEVEDAIKSGRHAHFLELGVLRTFEFVSSLRRMSVIVKRLKSQSMEVFVKGAPEVMADICDKDTFPADYDDLLSYYTKHGYRVIACAGKSMAGMSWIKAQRMRREQAESGLRFLGLIIFENKLKEGSAPAIEVLKNANIVTKMVTGDNPRTAISVARECGMVGQSAHVFMPTFVEGDQRSPRAVIDWSSVDDDRIKLDPYNLQPREVDPHVLDLEEFDFQDYQLALTGDVFRWMIDFAPIETVRRMLIKGTIFARMSPDEKHELVERLQAMSYTCGFCGDGANDCGALKAADIGISLSEAEASVAAPFTSNRGDISCVLDTIAEGRAALVTSFNCFSYICLTSLIQFSSVLLMYSIGSSLGDWEFMYLDFACLFLSVFSARTGPP